MNTTFALLLASHFCLAAEIALDESPAGGSEWGYRPAEDAVSPVNPPAFCWRPQEGIDRWELTLEPRRGSDGPVYQAVGIKWNVHCPPREFAAGDYVWRYRGVTSSGQTTAWSRPRAFTIPADAASMPLPLRSDLLERIPQSHPRLFVRPEEIPHLRQLAAGELNGQYRRLAAECDGLLANPPPTQEPPKYGDHVVSHDEEWREIWWGNRTYTVRALGSAATLAFTRLLGDQDHRERSEQYGRLAKRILLDCAQWDPRGATGYRYNDEAGMPYAYYFARTYTFVNDLLTDDQRRLCREVMKVRGEEMYRHLCPRHLWRPYSSHSNRAWHFLGEVGIAFHGEIEGADDWVWFAMNVFQNVYPVWSDGQGGWHEGMAYWSSYVSRFTWWADVMRSAVDLDAYKKPYFSQIGYYPIYLMPPGKRGGGFGDLTAHRTAESNRSLVAVAAIQAGAGHWQWYVDALGGPPTPSGYIGFVRGAMGSVEARPPDDLPSSRLFGGTGQAVLNSTLENADDDVQIVFKSSPFGTQSHGYEANNSFLLWAYGQRLLIRSGYRDIYGSQHHRKWMWSTRSVNNVTVDGVGQVAHSASSQGRITAFQTTASLDIVQGEAADAYRQAKTAENPDGRVLERFTRTTLFAKPELIVVFDRLIARRETRFEYWLHAVNEFELDGSNRVVVRAGEVACPITFLAPAGLEFSQTDQYDPNPRERVTLREWHLTAATPGKSRRTEFVAVMRPRRVDGDGDGAGLAAELTSIPGGYVLSAQLSDGRLVALLPTDDQATLSADGLETIGAILVRRYAADGTVVETVRE